MQRHGGQRGGLPRSTGALGVARDQVTSMMARGHTAPLSNAPGVEGLALQYLKQPDFLPPLFFFFSSVNYNFKNRKVSCKLEFSGAKQRPFDMALGRNFDLLPSVPRKQKPLLLTVPAPNHSQPPALSYLSAGPGWRPNPLHLQDRGAA